MALSQPPRPGFLEADWLPSCCRSCCDIDNDHRRWRTWRNMGKMCRELENHAVFMGKSWKIIRKSSISSKNGFHMLNKPGFLSHWYILDQNWHSQVGVPTLHLVARMLSFRRKVGCGWNAQNLREPNYLENVWCLICVFIYIYVCVCVWWIYGESMVNLWIIMVNNRESMDNRWYIWVNYNDLTVLPHWNHDLHMGNHPQMAELFRLVNYYNLPRLMLGPNLDSEDFKAFSEGNHKLHYQQLLMQLFFSLLVLLQLLGFQQKIQFILQSSNLENTKSPVFWHGMSIYIFGG